MFWWSKNNNICPAVFHVILPWYQFLFILTKKSQKNICSMAPPKKKRSKLRQKSSINRWFTLIHLYYTYISWENSHPTRPWAVAAAPAIPRATSAAAAAASGPPPPEPGGEATGRWAGREKKTMGVVRNPKVWKKNPMKDSERFWKILIYLDFGSWWSPQKLGFHFEKTNNTSDFAEDVGPCEATGLMQPNSHALTLRGNVSKKKPFCVIQCNGFLSAFLFASISGEANTNDHAKKCNKVYGTYIGTFPTNLSCKTMGKGWKRKHQSWADPAIP